MNGFVKLHRKMIEWEWYSDPNTKAVFLHLLLKANFKPVRYKGIELKEGELVTTLTDLAEGLNLTVRNVRTALDHLKSTGEIAVRATNRFSVITVANWEMYQINEQATDKQLTSKLTNNRQTTDTPKKKNIKNIYNNNNIYMQKREADELFERLWKLYPSKKGKGQVSDAKKTKLLAIGEEQMLRAIDRYVKDLEADEWRRPQNGSTFFNSGYVDYLDENYQPKQSERKKYDFKP